MSSDPPPGLVVDAGPIIAIVDHREKEHITAVRGFDALIAARSRIVVPLPIVFEVFNSNGYQTIRIENWRGRGWPDSDGSGRYTRGTLAGNAVAGKPGRSRD